MKKWLRYSALFGWFLVMPGFIYAEQPLRIIQKKQFDTFETGLGPLGCCVPTDTGVWLNDDLFAMTATQAVPLLEAEGKRLQRIMLIDTKAKTSQVLIDSGALVCWNSTREIASIQELGSEKIMKPTYRFVHLDAEGRVGPLIGETKISPYRCKVDISIPDGVVTTHLREGDGYIELSPPGLFNYDGERYAVWVRSDGSRVGLHVPADEFQKVAIYLPHLEKYLLNKFDSRGNSGTDRRLAGSSWKRPYALAPYRLMALDGTIETIPYPYILSEYGLNNRRFSLFLPTKPGILICTGQELLLLQGEQLTQFWPKPNLLERIKKEAISGVTLSPDGCKIAFRHYPDYKYSTKRLVTIINLCKKQ